MMLGIGLGVITQNSISGIFEGNEYLQQFLYPADNIPVVVGNYDYATTQDDNNLIFEDDTNYIF